MRALASHRRIGTPFLVLCGLLLALAPCAPARANTSSDEIAFLEQQVAAAPRDPDAHFDLAMAYARTPDLEKAWAELKEVDQLDPAYADQLITKLKPLSQANPDNIEVLFRLGFAYYFRGFYNHDAADKAKARAEFQDILAVDPEYVWALDYLSYLTYDAGDLSGALDLARKATAADPNNAVAHFLLGEGLFKAKQPFAAALQMAQAMALRGAVDLHP